MTTIDWGIVAVYGALLVGIGFYASRRQSNTDEYFRGSRQIPWWALGISIMATSFSAASLLGGPGQGYNSGFLWLQLQLGDLLGYGLVIAILLPFFVRLNITTAYEYLERRFDAKTRSLGSICFLLFVISRLGALLYAASLVVSQVTALPLAGAIALVGVVSVAYTVVGGITAVVWTDVLQFAMIFVGILAGIGAAAQGVPGGLGELWATAAAAGKFRVLDATWDPTSLTTLPTAVIAYGVLAFAVAGTNQQSVQRYVSCPDVASGRKAALLGWFTGFVGVAITLLLGVLLFAFYSLNADRLPPGVEGDRILPYFISNETLPIGAAGLLVAAIFAAAMSSIDSALHALSTCITVDFYRRYAKPERSEAHYLQFSQLLIVVWGALGILSAFYVASTGEDLLPFLVKYSTMSLGPLLGIFLLGVLVPRANATGAFWGSILAVVLLALNSHYGWLEFPGIWRSAVSAPLTIALGSLIALWTKPPAKQATRALTLWSDR